MQKEYANEILAASHAGYEKIAADFSRTRGAFWSELLFVRDLIPEGSRLLDIGCGNGRFFSTFGNKPLDYTGVDFSEGLIGVAHERYHERARTSFIVGDALALPFPDHSFDNAVSFAVLHHIPSRAYRVQFLREAARVVKPGGLIVVTAWNVWHSRPGIVLKFALKKILGGARALTLATLSLVLVPKKMHGMCMRSRCASFVLSLTKPASPSSASKRSVVRVARKIFL